MFVHSYLFNIPYLFFLFIYVIPRLYFISKASFISHQQFLNLNKNNINVYISLICHIRPEFLCFLTAYIDIFLFFYHQSIAVDCNDRDLFHVKSILHNPIWMSSSVRKTVYRGSRGAKALTNRQRLYPMPILI